MSTYVYTWPPLAITGSFPLPAGAATSANQVLEIAQLTAIDGKLPSTLGTKTATNSLSVTMASDQPGQKMDIEYALGQYVASNSTTTPLGISGNFTGSWVETTNYAAIQVGVYSDQNSSSLGFKIEFSANGSTVDHTHYYTYESSSNGTGYTFQPEFKYFRVNYTNDGVAQTYLTIYTALKPVSLFPSQYRVEQAVTGQSQALVTKGVIYGLTTGGGGGYVAVKVNPSGALAVAASQDTSPWVVSGTVAATQSGTWGVGLNAGTNVVGKIGIDQTTNGTTNAVYVNNFPATQAVTGTFYQATQPVSAASLPLPSNASTANPEGSLTGGTAGSKSLAAGGIYNSSAPTLTNGQQAALQLDASGNLKTTATFTGSIGAVNQGTAAAVASAWPILMTDGTNTASVKAASTAAVAGDKAVVVTVSPNTPLPAGTNTLGFIKNGGLTKSNTPVYNSYSTTSVTTSAYVQLIASTTSLANMVQIFDSSGQAMILATGAAGSEVDQVYVPPGGADFNLSIAAGTRVAIKALTATASSGYLLVNLLG